MLSDRIQQIYTNSFFSGYVAAAKDFNRWSYLLVLVAFTITLILYIDNVKQIDLNLQDLSNKRESLRDISSTNKVLYANYIELQNPERIDRIARETLGMIVPIEAPKKIIVTR